jgi:hypothetical protein
MLSACAEMSRAPPLETTGTKATRSSERVLLTVAASFRTSKSQFDALETCASLAGDGW